MSTKVFAAIALFALTNGALINLIMASRLVYGMSREGIVPKALGRVHPGRRTPYVAIAFTASLAALLVLVGDLETLADTTVLLLLFVFVCVNTAVLVLRREPVEHEHFRAPDLRAGARRDRVRRADRPEGVRRPRRSSPTPAA